MVRIVALLCKCSSNIFFQDFYGVPFYFGSPIFYTTFHYSRFAPRASRSCSYRFQNIASRCSQGHIFGILAVLFLASFLMIFKWFFNDLLMIFSWFFHVFFDFFNICSWLFHDFSGFFTIFLIFSWVLFMTCSWYVLWFLM